MLCQGSSIGFSWPSQNLYKSMLWHLLTRSTQSSKNKGQAFAKTLVFSLALLVRFAVRFFDSDEAISQSWSAPRWKNLKILESIMGLEKASE